MIALTEESVRAEVHGKTLLITGGTGSFGHELLSKIAGWGCGEVRIFSRDELKQDVMRNELNDPTVKFFIGDVRDRNSVDAVMRGVDLAFHAAALKQVPSCEFFPLQAVMTNAIGSHNVIESAYEHGVQKLVCLGTDKAVYPVNTMGITKALMEKMVQAAARNRFAHPNGTTACCVRYGNVLYSRGSVIPVFVRQIRQNLPLTVTGPEMTRFLLPLAQAIDLVLFAFLNAQPGDIFIRKAPAATMMDLAVAVRNVFQSNVAINVIGIRHGEKMHETLATLEELRAADDLGDYYRCRMDARDLNYSKYLTEGQQQGVFTEEYTSENARRLNVPELEQLLCSLPEIQAGLAAHGMAAVAR